ncbi:MAG: DUF1501 domain-containing protein [Planctomycetales bacterium]
MQLPILDSTLSRRTLLRQSACGFGAVALQSLFTSLSSAAATASGPHHTPKAKRIIFLFMAGGPSQHELFYPKPLLTQNHGKRVAFPFDNRKVGVGVDKYLALAPDKPIIPRGQSGMLMSDYIPHLAKVADDLCLLRAVSTDSEAHTPATLQLHTGVAIDVRPSMGAWVSYGLGTPNKNLPSFLTIHPDTDVRTYGSSFLPAKHQGTVVKIGDGPNDPPIRYLRDPDADPTVQQTRLKFQQGLNRNLFEREGTDPQMEGLIESFELAFRMQTETPKLVDLSGESKATQEMYGLGKPQSDKNGRACLLARRMSEAGVPFVQVTMGGWDHHGDIRGALPGSCGGMDQPVAALIQDLKARGMLNDTLVVWSGEFGRTPYSQDLSGTSPIEKHGREHQPESFCAFLAGAGVKPGFTFGETDDFGLHPVSGKVHLHDLHATMLHLLGLDHERLTYRHAGRDYRLTDVYGRVVTEILKA